MSKKESLPLIPYLSQKTITRLLALLVLLLFFAVGYFHIQWKNEQNKHNRLQIKYDALLLKVQKSTSN